MKILYTKTIYRDGQYVAFPTLAKLPDGRVLCAFRHAPERQATHGAATHVDPAAKDVLIISTDGGKTFDPTLHTILDDEMSRAGPVHQRPLGRADCGNVFPLGAVSHRGGGGALGCGCL